MYKSSVEGDAHEMLDLIYENDELMDSFCNGCEHSLREECWDNQLIYLTLKNSMCPRKKDWEDIYDLLSDVAILIKEGVPKEEID